MSPSSGRHDPAFQPVVELFDHYLESLEDYGAQLCLYWRGVPVVDRWGGVEASEDSVTGMFSAGKGIAALCIAALVESGELELDRPVAYYWPEFAAAGKADISVRTVLSHRAGMIGVPGGFTHEDLATGFSAREKLAAARPYWHPGSDFGYHAITIGMIMEGLFLAIRGEQLQAFHAREIRIGRGADVFLGLPADQDHRYVPVRPAHPDPALQEDLADLLAYWGNRDTLTAVAMNNPARTGGRALGDVSPNVPGIRAFGGSGHAATGTARGIARVSEQHSHGTDLVLGAEMAFAMVFMKPTRRLPFASHAAFGHDGAGGALGYADPLYELAFGYTPYPMQAPGGADPKAIELSRVAREVVRGLEES